VRYPESHETVEHTVNAETTRHYGAVMDVQGSALKVWVPGITSDDGDWMPLPPRFFGRHARSGATFEVIVADGSLHDAVFEFQTEGYLELEDFAARIG
jgi:hypothetical protein